MKKVYKYVCKVMNFNKRIKFNDIIINLIQQKPQMSDD